MEMQSLRFIGEAIEVEFDQAPAFEKAPDCPARFVWRGETHRITELLSEWHDFGRRGRMAENMRPAHLAAASRRGSWGVGRYYFRVRTEAGRVFDIYYDRAPTDSGGRKGTWFLFREMAEAE